MNPRTVKVALKIAAVMLAIASAVVVKLSAGDALTLDTVLGIVTSVVGATGDGT